MLSYDDHYTTLLVTINKFNVPIHYSDIISKFNVMVFLLRKSMATRSPFSYKCEIKCSEKMKESNIKWEKMKQD